MGLIRTRALKLFIIIPNFLGIILAILMVGISTDVLINTVDKYRIVGTSKQKMRAMAALLLSAGLVLGIVSFLAIYGTLKNNRSMLVTYYMIMSIILPLEISSGIWAFVAQNDIKTELKDHLNNQMSKYDGSTSWNNTEIIRIQYHMKCCGVDDYLDWNDTLKAMKWPTDISTFPSSCCNVKGNEKWECDEEEVKESSNTNGCFYKIWKRSSVFGLLSVCVFCVQIFMFPGMICLVKMIKEGKTSEL